MTRLVMDTIFLEVLTFKVTPLQVARARVAFSQEDVLRALMVDVGLELIDYGSFTIQPMMLPAPRHLEPWDLVSCYSKAYRERIERDALAGRY
jgi:hypothetical protein